MIQSLSPWTGKSFLVPSTSSKSSQANSHPSLVNTLQRIPLAVNFSANSQNQNRGSFNNISYNAPKASSPPLLSSPPITLTNSAGPNPLHCTLRPCQFSQQPPHLWQQHKPLRPANGRRRRSANHQLRRGRPPLPHARPQLPSHRAL